MKPSPTRLTGSLVVTIVAIAAACVLSAQGTTITLTPASPTVQVGQSLQLSETGAVVPQGVSTGAWHTCVMYTDRSIRCTGLNNQGEIGNNSWISVNEPQLAQTTAAPDVLLMGNEHTCTWMADGRMQCWGTNYTGQLGDGTMGGFAMTPQFVHNISTATKGVTGGFHTCAILQDNSVQCWGRNQDGQIGNGDATTDVALPTPVINLGGVALDLFGGGYHTCTKMTDGTIKCWGRNARGQVGDGTTDTPIAQPHTVVGLSNVNRLALGGYHSCALLNDNTVKCWGQSDYGQIGSPGAFSATPVTVPGLTNVEQLAAGMRHTCAVTSDGTMRCWGNNDFGQLGDQTTAYTSTPVVVQGVSSPSRIAAGWGHTCAWMRDLSVRCWGENDYGELGIGTTGPAQMTPVTMHLTASTWTSSNPSVATVTPLGFGATVTGVSRGTTTITMTDPFGNSGSVVLTVKDMLPLAVIRQGDGSGTVTSTPSGIQCPTACSATFVSDSQVTLTAAPAADSLLAGWTGCDSVSGTTCTVTMANARSVTAIFILQRFPLTVTKSGIGKGTVTSSPAGINCGTACSSDFTINTTVTLTPTPALGSIFNGWTGCDAVNGNACTVRVTGAKSVTANFLGIPLL